MKTLYVVKRSFKSGGKLFAAGSLLNEDELHNIRLFKIRLNEGVVIPLPQKKEELETLHYYFKERVGIDLREALKARVSKGSEKAVTPKQVSSSTHPGTTNASTPVKPKPLTGKTAKPSSTKK